MSIERPMFPPRADSLDSISHLAAIQHHPKQSPAGTAPIAIEGLSRRGMIAALAVLAAAMTAVPAAASDADAELIALGKQFEILVDRYYTARAVWAPALSAAHAEHDAAFAEIDRATPHYELPPDKREEMRAFFEAACERHGVREASENLDAIAQQLSPVANAILALPVTTIEGLRVKALVVFKEVAPLTASGDEYDFDNPPAFQRLFSAVAEVCGLTGKIAATGFGLSWPETDVDYDGDEGEEA